MISKCHIRNDSQRIVLVSSTVLGRFEHPANDINHKTEPATGLTFKSPTEPDTGCTFLTFTQDSELVSNSVYLMVCTGR